MTATPAPLSVDGFTRATARVGDTTLHYWLGGAPDGVPVLLWHGFLGTAHGWRKLMPLLAAAGCRVLAPDMRGYGDSDKPAGVAGYDGLALAAEFRALARQLGFGAGQRIVLVGHDMGAPPALLWAAHHPDEILGVAYLEEPALLPDVLANIIVYRPGTMANGSLWWWPLAFAGDMPERLIVGHERAFLSWFYETYTAVPGSIDEAAVAETLRSFRGRDGVHGAFGVYRAAFATVEQTARFLARKIDVPILAVGGDKVLGANVGATLAALGSRVRSEVVADCGHFIPEERPAELARLLLAFLAEIGAPSGPPAGVATLQ